MARATLSECSISVFEREQLGGGVTIIRFLYSLYAVLVITGISISVAHADYLDMGLSVYKNYPQWGSNISVSMNYYAGVTYRVQWKKANQGGWTKGPNLDAATGIQNGACTSTTCTYWILNLSCNTNYKVRAKIEGKGWRNGSATTLGCGLIACPYGGWFDGANCQIGRAPEGTTAFIWGGNYYYTPLPPPNRCPYPGSWFDSANCYVQGVPAGVQPFIWSNHWYYGAYP